MNPISGLTPDGRAVQGDADDRVGRCRLIPQADAELTVAADEVALAERPIPDVSVAANRIVLRPGGKTDSCGREAGDLEPANDVTVRGDRQPEMGFRPGEAAPVENDPGFAGVDGQVALAELREARGARGP